jgi:hypothetical protein
MRHGGNWMIRAANQRYQRLRGSLITDPRLSRAASFVTPCVRLSSRPAEKYPPICAGTGSIAITTLAVQICTFCASANL